VLSACGGGGGGSSDPQPERVLNSIQITGIQSSYIVGDQSTITVTGTYNTGQTETISGITWSSSNSSVATINASGSLSAISAGTSTITGSVNNRTASVQIEVISPDPTLVSIQFTGILSSYVVGTQDTISVTGTFDNNQTAVLSDATYSSSNPAVATINTNGRLSALSEGSTTITANASNLTVSLVIDVVAPTLTSIEIVSASASSPAGLSVQLSARGTFNNGVTRTLDGLTWSSDDETIASISNIGLVTAVGQGQTSLRATKDDINAAFTLTVTSAILQSINIQLSDASIALGTTTQALALGTFSDGATVEVNATWMSSNALIASIDEQGQITGAGIGQSVISASSGNISSTSNPTITITDATVVNIETSPTFTSIPLGLEESLGATLIFSDNSTQPATNATWQTSDSSVATVATSNGEVTITAVSVGTVEISASANGFTSSFSFDAVDAIPTSIAFSIDTLSLPQGASQGLSVIATLSDNSNSNVSDSAAFSISDSALGSFAAPNSGQVTFTAAQEGAGTISASFAGFTASLLLEVTAAQPTNLSSSNTNVEVAAGLSTSASILVNYTDGSELAPLSGVTWAIDDTSIASLSATGTATASVTGITQGTTTLTATFEGLSLVFDITVTAALPVSLTFDIPIIYLDDAPVQLAAIMTFTDNSTANVSDQVVWSSTNSAIATVGNSSSTKGLLTPVDQGDVSITAAFNDGAISETISTTILQPRVLKGFAVYRYNDSGSITIGETGFEIELDFDDVNDDSVTLKSIDSNLLAPAIAATAISDVSDTDALNFSTSALEVTQNSTESVASIQNSSGLSAVIQVHEVKSFGDGNVGNLVMFSWAIRSDQGTNYSTYTVADELKFFQCREITSTCTQIGFSLNANVNASATVSPRPAQHIIGSYILVAVGKDYTVTNLEAVEPNNLVDPSFGGLSNNQIIAAGEGVSFFIQVPPTFDVQVFPTYRFNIDNNTSMSFTVMASFRSN
jgi:uncharacterized protein YjdB